MSLADDYIQDGNTFTLKANPGFALSDQTSSGRGRCVIATKNYSRGEVVLEEDPAAFVVFSSCSDYSCACCAYSPDDGRIFGLNAEDPQRYCSESCIARDRELHSVECDALRRIRELGIEGGMDACNLIMRIAARRKQDGGSQESQRLPVLGRYVRNQID
jgi:hypothetical protein